ncbi:acyl carrier protein [Kibdelosporangium aridum]|uniref:Acyl carrier protein n=2 Tax=Kibdelosporangium aridum TaxID=2030 RepID=A0A428Z4W4_KIBAR|nr:acyl carrier protein [Kibdelosporangium aridum]
MRKFVWEGEWPSLEDNPDQTFDELGYDSLALLETHSRIRRDYGVQFSDEDLTELTTPQELVDFVNSQIKAA